MSMQYTDADSQQFAEAALADAKQEGLRLAVRARWIALAAIAVTLPIANPRFEVVYFEIVLLLFGLIGWGQLRVGKAGRSVPELVLMFCDLALGTVVAVVPNPLIRRRGRSRCSITFRPSCISSYCSAAPCCPIPGAP